MYFPQTDTNYGIYPQSPGEGSSWEVSYGLGTDPFGLGGLQSMSGGPPLGAEGIRAAQRAIDSIMAQYGILPEGLPDWVYDVAGGLGQPGGPEMQEQEDARPVTIVQRNEAGEEIGRVPGVRIGYGDNARVVTAEELIRINQERRRSGQAPISTSTPPFAPEIVDESGAAITNKTGSIDSNADANADANNSNDSDMRTNNTTSGSIYGPTQPGEGGGGGGVRQIRILGGQVITIPEGKTALQHVGELVAQGMLTQEVYDNLLERQSGTSTDLPTAGEVVTDPSLFPGGEGSDSTVTDTTGTGQVTDTTGTSDVTGSTDATGTGDVTTGNLTTGDVTTSLQGGDTTVATGDTSFTGGDLYGGDVNTGDTSLTTGDTLLTTGATTLTGGDVTTGPVTTDVTSTGGTGGAGGAGGSVNISFGDGTGGQGITPEQALQFFTQLSAIPAFQTGEALEGGAVPGIYPTAIGSLPQATSFIQSMLELDRAVSPQQAETALDLYRQITGGVREAQSPLMKSLARRAEMQGVEAERLMGPLSFLEERGATQAGYGQAAALGRTLDPALREQQAGRLREEQRNVNLQLASNLLGQQRATAGLMADIESGIYGRMAPEIGVDPGQILGIAGTDIQNILGEQAARQYSEAIREGSRREQQAKILETGVSLIPDFKFGPIRYEEGKISLGF